MRPQWYCDAIPLTLGGDTGISGPMLRSRMLGLLHGEGLAKNVISQPWFRDYARLSYPQAVPDDFCGDWVRFVRYRVPSLASDRHEGEEHGLLRKRRMETARKAQMTYFILRSARTGQRFSLVVNREQGEPQSGECAPNGYGFCVTSSPFSLPELPWA